MTGANAITFILMMTLIPLAAIIIYALLVQNGTLPVPRQKFKELIAAGDAEAAWYNQVLFGMKLGLFPLGFAAVLLGYLVFAAGSTGSIRSYALTTPLICIVFAAFLLASGVRELSRGWEQAKTGMIGRSIYKMIEKHHVRAENPKKTTIS